MTTLQEVRQQYPQYNDMPDADLADALHGKFYSDMPKMEFYQAIGLPSTLPRSAPTPPTEHERLAETAALPFKGIPIGGEYVDQIGAALSAVAHPLTGAGAGGGTYGERYDTNLARNRDVAKQVAADNPIASEVAKFGGGAVSLGLAGVPALGARMLGMAGGNVASRMALGGATMGGVGTVDSYVRGQDPVVGGLMSAVGGAAAPGISAAITRAITPTRVPAAMQPAVSALEREGVPLTAGERSGSVPLRYAESQLGDMPGSGGRASKMLEARDRAYTRAGAGAIDEPADLLTPDVLGLGPGFTRPPPGSAAERIGQKFRDLSTRNDMDLDPRSVADMMQVQQRYTSLLPSMQRPIVADIINDIMTQAAANGGKLPGQLYQDTRSMLTSSAFSYQSSGNTAPLGRALAGIRDALDNAMGRSVSPADAALWREARRQWGSLEILAKAMSGADPRTQQGYLLPSALRAAVKGSVGQAQLADLARSGQAILKPLPNSGTASRSYFMQSLPGVAGAALGGMTGDPQNAIMGAGIGLLGPGLAGRALLSGPMQRYLSNQRAGPGTEQFLTGAMQGSLYDFGRRLRPLASQ